MLSHATLTAGNPATSSTLQFLDFSVSHIPHVWAFQLTEQRRSIAHQYFPDYWTGKFIPARQCIGAVRTNVRYSRTIRAFHNHFPPPVRLARRSVSFCGTRTVIVQNHGSASVA